MAEVGTYRDGMYHHHGKFIKSKDDQNQFQIPTVVTKDSEPEVDSMETEMMKEEKTTNHYYGTVVPVGNGADVSFISRGAIFILKDKIRRNGVQTSHPYLIISQTYLDNFGKVVAFGLSSTPASIDMIPVNVNGSVSFIDHYKTHTFNLSDFNDPSARYLGQLINPRVMNLATDFYGLSLGMNLVRSSAEVYADYLDYVREFEVRCSGIERCFRMSTSSRCELEFVTSANRANVEKVSKINDNENETDTQIADDNIIEFPQTATNIESSDEYVNTDTDGKNIIIDINDSELIGEYSRLEANPGSITVPYHTTKWPENIVKLFMLIEKLDNIQRAGELFGLQLKSAVKRRAAIKTLYNITYKQA